MKMRQMLFKEIKINDFTAILEICYVLNKVLPWSQGAFECQQLKLQQLYQTTSNHSYTSYKEQELNGLACVWFRAGQIRCDDARLNHRFKYDQLHHSM